jgi:hypothetical protein
MKLAIIALICFALCGCEKTIHEASASHHTIADTRSTAAASAFT